MGNVVCGDDTIGGSVRVVVEEECNVSCVVGMRE